MSRSSVVEIDSARAKTPVNPSLIATARRKSSALERESSEVGRQYIPMDIIQMEQGLELRQPSKLRKVLGNFQLKHGPDLPRSNVTIDLLLAILCFTVVHFLYLGNLDFTSPRTVVFDSSLIFIVLCLSASGIYNAKRLRNLNQELTILVMCWICAFAAVGLFAFLTKTAADVSRVWLTTSMVITLASLIGVRVLNGLRLKAKSKANSRNVIICGHGSRINPVLRSLNQSTNPDIQVAMVFELPEQQSYESGTPDSLPDMTEKMITFIESQRQSGSAIEQVWIAASTNQSQVAEDLSNSLFNSSVDVCVASDQMTDRLLAGDVTRLAETNIVNISETSLSPAAEQFKRVFDVFFASVALLLLCIPMVIIAGLIKLESTGPALFRQKRYGIDGREIEVLKFRSMGVHSDSQVRQATRNDARITRIGKILRSTSLDELPQLINVMCGTMSLIGPRPHAIAHNEIWRTQIQGYMLRHKVRPGITGLAQVKGWRGETDTLFKMQQRVKYDLEYIRNWSPWLDMKIMLLTIVKGFRNENAY